MDAIVDDLAANPLLVLFLVAAAGQLLGRVRVGRLALGIAGVLFAGLAFGGVDERFALPDVVLSLGLGLFVYCIGLSFGPSIVPLLRRGVRPNLVVVTIIVLAG